MEWLPGAIGVLVADEPPLPPLLAGEVTEAPPLEPELLAPLEPDDTLVVG